LQTSPFIQLETPIAEALETAHGVLTAPVDANLLESGAFVNVCKKIYMGGFIARKQTVSSSGPLDTSRVHEPFRFSFLLR
jgi:hypothetical protein